MNTSFDARQQEILRELRDDDDTFAVISNCFDAALAFVNRMRDQVGLEPLEGLRRGVRTDPSRCPIALSIGQGACVDGDSLWWGDIPDELAAPPEPLPVDVGLFVYFFDAGYYPALSQTAEESDQWLARAAA